MSTPATTLYGIPNCDTVKRARAWLVGHEQHTTFHDFKKQGVPEARLDHWLTKLGWEALLNRKGSTWRKLDAAAQAGVTDRASARALMLKHASVIKRPVVEWADAQVTVGFAPQDWETRLG
ncbi:arsenate reductase [Rhodoferax sp.]|jgi:arsenate reductase|uniref:arsenate reductase n=1 Tax=Rhodoferax sp. TaxID=50421 RepID=UPI00378353F6